ncbi:MAG: hypothetical protein M5U12_17080 [Verrucomicrobia bacterium]|nr:hypothetical protein [Verrucomicrobiota bacterium]
MRACRRREQNTKSVPSSGSRGQDLATEGGQAINAFAEVDRLHRDQDPHLVA